MISVNEKFYECPTKIGLIHIKQKSNFEAFEKVGK